MTTTISISASNSHREQILQHEISLIKKQLLNSRINENETQPLVQGGLIFTGNVHDTVPRSLLISKSLGPREKIMWQVIRLYAPGNRAAVFPSYTELQHQLATADKDKASRDSVSQAIKILRLERWLSLVDTIRLRDKKTGRLLACRNIYALHDEPLPFDDNELLDPGYMLLLEKCVQDKNCKTLRVIARRQMNRMRHDTSMRHQHSRLRQIENRIGGIQAPIEMVPPQVRAHISPANINHTKPENTRSPGSGLRENPPELNPSPGSGLRETAPSQSRSPDTQNSDNSLKNTAVRNSAVYVRNSSINKKNTYVYPGSDENSRLPATLADRLSPTDRAEVLKMASAVEPETATQIIHQACLKITDRQLRNPCGWVLKMLQQARQGNWNPPVVPAAPARMPAEGIYTGTEKKATAASPCASEPGSCSSASSNATTSPISISRSEFVRNLLAGYKNAKTSRSGAQAADGRS